MKIVTIEIYDDTTKPGLSNRGFDYKGQPTIVDQEFSFYDGRVMIELLRQEERVNGIL